MAKHFMLAALKRIKLDLKMLKKLGFVAILLCTCSPVLGHGIWFAERAKNTALIYGIGADDLESVKRLPKITSFSAYDLAWQKTNAKLKAWGPIVVVDGENDAVAAVMANGVWSLTQDDHWVAKGRDQVPDAKIAEKTFKYAVHLNGPIRVVPKLSSQTLQIIPTGSSFPTLLASDVTYQVLYKGKPVAAAKVLGDFVNDPDAQPMHTDADGFVTVPIRNQGLNVIAAIYKGPSDQPSIVDSIEHLATLSFVLAHKPE